MHDPLEINKFLRSKFKHPKEELSKSFAKITIILKRDILEIKIISKCLFAIKIPTSNLLISFAMNTKLIEEFVNMKFNKIIFRRLYKKYYYDIELK